MGERRVTKGLIVRHGPDTVGRLEPDRFVYTEHWLANGWAISSSMPLRNEPFSAEARSWFGNLLPEGTARERIARRLRVDPSDDFQLLTALGGDCAGALTLLPEGATPPRPAVEYTPFSAEALEDLARGGTAAGLVREGVRLSLAGAQDKVPVFVDDAGALHLPSSDAASTHILKLSSSDVSSLVENEAMVMGLAASLDLSVAPISVQAFGDRLGLLVERYDRATEERPVRRLHQEDFAQALGRDRRDKYEEASGPSLAACVELIRRNGVRPALEIREFLRWIAFCFVVGNRDNHAKNVSRLLHGSGSRWRLAPFYDLLNTTAYRRLSRDLAFRVGGENRVNQLTRGHWEAQAASMQVAPRLLLREVEGMSVAVEDALPRARDRLAERLGGEDRLVQFVRAITKANRAGRRTLR